jgi:hypothetical protein
MNIPTWISFPVVVAVAGFLLTHFSKLVSGVNLVVGSYLGFTGSRYAVMALMLSLALFTHLINGFRNQDLRRSVAQLTQQPYSASQASYDLRRLCRKGLLFRQPAPTATWSRPMVRKLLGSSPASMPGSSVPPSSPLIHKRRRAATSPFARSRQGRRRNRLLGTNRLPPLQARVRAIL